MGIFVDYGLIIIKLGADMELDLSHTKSCDTTRNHDVIRLITRIYANV